MVEVSVIIPIYNSEPWLAECLNSVCHQTLKDIEIICVNDGSTDNSLKILQEYAGQDERIQIIDQDNHGLSYARNAGFKKAKGKYVYFLDSDDYIATEGLEILADTMESENLEILLFNTKVFADEGADEKRVLNDEKYFKRTQNYPVRCSGEELFRLLKEHKEYITPVSTQLYDRNFLNEKALLFQEDIIHEDELYTFQCLLLASRVGYLDKQLYFRRVRNSSIMDLKQSEKMIYSAFSCFMCLKEMIHFCFENDFEEQNRDAIFSNLERMANICRYRYGTLDLEGRAKVLEMAGNDRFFLNFFVLALFDSNENIKLLKQKMEQAKKETEQAKKETEQARKETEQARKETEQARKETEQARKETKQTRKQIKLKEKQNADGLKQISQQNKKISKLERELKNVKSGWSFRIGRMITFVPRKIRGGIRCWQEHGFLYTLKRCGEKLHIVQKGPGRANLDKRSKLFLFSTPWHGNLGDQAIVLGEYEILKKMFPSNEIVEIPTQVCLNLMKDGNDSSKTELNIGKNDIVFIHGGGNLGDIWVNEEQVHRWIVQKFAHNKIVFMPQSIFFHNHESGMTELKNSREIYAQADDLTILTRDNVSYEFAKKNFVKAKVVMVPDAATYLEGRFPETATKREGVCFFLRKDKEKVSSDELLTAIREYLRRRGVPYEISDTVIANKDLKTNELRTKAISDTLLQARKSRLVITDRFHGVIFSVITHTPVIAFKSYDTKISSGIRWFKELDWVHYAENMEAEEIERLIDKYCLQGEVSVNRFTGCPDILEKEFRKLL